MPVGHACEPAPPVKASQTLEPNSKRPRALHLFSGPSDRHDGIRAILEKIGWECVDVDIVNASSHGRDSSDLLDDALWQKIFSDISAGVYDFVWIGTPCSTFSRARERPPGPRPLRSLDQIRGLPKHLLTPKEQKQLDEGNFLAVKSSQAAGLCLGRRVGFAIENPEPVDKSVSIFLLPEFLDLAGLPGVRSVDFDQCTHGAETRKPTRVLYAHVDFSSLGGRCQHPPQWWNFQDATGQSKWVHAPHPPLAGRVRDSGEFATKQAAAYPGGLNHKVVKCIIQRGRACLPSLTLQ